MLLSFNSWCHKMESIHKVFALISGVQRLSWGNHFVSELQAHQLLFFVEHEIERTDKQWVFNCRHLTDISGTKQLWKRTVNICCQ